MFELPTLQLIIYLILGFSATAYVALDGFDLGVGCLHLLAKDDDERRIFINAIGPVWDGNAVWIVITSGVLLTGFPRAFATIMPAFYMPVVLLLAGFMFRAVSIEFRSKRKRKSWRQGWDIGFFLSSLVLAFSLGLIVGNLIYGLPINAKGELDYAKYNFFNPYSILIGLFSVALFVTYGALYLLMKTEGALQKRIQKWLLPLISIFLILWGVTTIATFFYEPKMLERFREQPIYSVFVIFSLSAIFSVLFFAKKRFYGWAFLAMMSSIVSFMALFGIGTYPYLVFSTINVKNSLTIYNSSSQSVALTVLMFVALSGVFLAGFYVSYIYKVFRGKVKIDHSSY